MSTNSILDLADDFQVRWLGVLGAKDLGRTARVCSRYRELCNDNNLWRRLYTRTYNAEFPDLHEHSWKQLFKLGNVWSLAPSCSPRAPTNYSPIYFDKDIALYEGDGVFGLYDSKTWQQLGSLTLPVGTYTVKVVDEIIAINPNNSLEHFVQEWNWKTGQIHKIYVNDFNAFSDESIAYYEVSKNYIVVVTETGTVHVFARTKNSNWIQHHCLNHPGCSGMMLVGKYLFINAVGGKAVCNLEQKTHWHLEHRNCDHSKLEGDYLLTRSNEEIIIWDLENKKALRRFQTTFAEFQYVFNRDRYAQACLNHESNTNITTLDLKSDKLLSFSTPRLRKPTLPTSQASYSLFLIDDFILLNLVADLNKGEGALFTVYKIGRDACHHHWKFKYKGRVESSISFAHIGKIVAFWFGVNGNLALADIQSKTPIGIFGFNEYNVQYSISMVQGKIMMSHPILTKYNRGFDFIKSALQKLGQPTHEIEQLTLERDS